MNFHNYHRKWWIKIQPFWGKLVHSSDVELLRPYFEKKRGICIGGVLHWKFQEYLSLAKEVVDVNLAGSYLDKSVKVDHLTDAANLNFAIDNEFDFVSSSHLLEHLTNPIKALHEWMRVINKGGIIYCAVPDKRFTIDCNRKRTTLQHLIDDYHSNVGLDDVTHIQEFINNWEESMDVISKDRLVANIRSNSAIYTHFHVWIKKDVIDLFAHVGLENIFVALLGNTVHIVGRKGR